ncbi:hypothetical protein JYU34_005368 [Plutella xylostella]|uniref:Reverse transcriptase n=1 Tax=Plutella xylostella TaxID=51655 RepID=A0ABQ7QWJ5_PLUXY|nr:hypothetical protein JYU34_005368 [Plutella xylostella]
MYFLSFFTSEEQLGRWTEPFKAVLDRTQPEPTPTGDVSGSDKLLDIETTPPSFAEIVTAVKQLKNGKAPGIDNIHMDMLKADAPTTATLLYPLLTRIWETGLVPAEWKQGLLVKVPKKGDLSQCDNWRGITTPVCRQSFSKDIAQPHTEKSSTHS